MITEVVRLVVTLAATATGFLIGHSVPDSFEGTSGEDVSPIVGAVLGAGIGEKTDVEVFSTMRISIGRIIFAKLET